MYATRTHLITGLLVLAVSLNVTFGQENLPASPEGIRPLLIGTELPTFDASTLDGKAFDLTAAVKARPTILIYYRGGW